MNQYVGACSCELGDRMFADAVRAACHQVRLAPQHGKTAGLACWRNLSRSRAAELRASSKSAARARSNP